MIILNKLFLILVFCGLIFPVSTVNSQEPSSLIVNYKTDDFILLVRTLPPKPIVGTSYFKLELFEPENYSPIPTGKIKISITSMEDSDEKFQVLAVKKTSESKDYHANITFETYGDWNISFIVEINGVQYSEIGSQIYISQKDMSNVAYGNYVFFGVLLIMVSVISILVKSSKKNRNENRTNHP